MNPHKYTTKITIQKKLNVFSLVFLFGLMASTSLKAQIGIGTLEPDSSAQLEVQSTDKGALLPRMTEVQRDGISSPSEGLLIYCTDCSPIGLYNYTSNSWFNLKGAIVNETSDDVYGDPSNLQNTTTGHRNAVLGRYAGESITTGANNSILGYGAGRNMTIGGGNIIIGASAGQGAGNGNMFLGRLAGYGVGGRDDLLFIENSQSSAPLIGGNFANDKLGVNVHIDTLDSDAATFTVGGDLQLGSGIGAKINEFSTDGTLADNSSTAVPTEAAVKYYVDNNSGLSTDANGNILGNDNVSSNLTHGLDNTSLGKNTLNMITTGNVNTAIGSGALSNVTSGGVNTALGYNALRYSTGSTNIGIGPYAGQNEQGDNKLYISNSGGSNPLIGGDLSLRKLGVNVDIDTLDSDAATLTVGGDLQLGSGIGAKVSEFSIDGTLADNSSTAVPTEAAVKTYVDNNSINIIANNNWYHASGSPSTVPTGCCNVAYGLDALGVNATGGHNTALGHSSLQFNVGGSYNVGLGSGSLRANTTGSGNIAIGRSTMDANTTGSWNTFMGFNSGSNNTTGSYNTGVGYYSAVSLISGTSNVAIGQNALRYSTTGNLNTAIGSGALQHSTGSGHVAIGFAAGSTAVGDNLLFIENSQSITPLIGGNFSSNNVGINMPVYGLVNGHTLQVGGDASKTGGGNWQTNSDRRLKKEIQPMNAEEMLDRMLQLQGVTYLWNDTVTGYPRSEDLQYGFIAQNIEQVWPSKISKDAHGYLMAGYGDYDAMLVESIRALNNNIETLQTENEDLRAQLKALNKHTEEKFNELHELKALVESLVQNKSLKVSQ